MGEKIQTVMTPDPVTIDADAALVDAASLMADRDVGALVVVDGGEVVGVVTDRATSRSAVPPAARTRPARRSGTCAAGS